MAATDQYDRVGPEPPIARVSPDREVDIGAITRALVERQTFAGLFSIPKNSGGLHSSALGFRVHVRPRFHSRETFTVDTQVHAAHSLQLDGINAAQSERKNRPPEARFLGQLRRLRI